MINILFNDKTYGACLEKLVYTNNAEYAKTIIAEMNKEADYDKYYAEMKARYEEAGLYDLVDEFNKQYEEWKNK